MPSADIEPGIGRNLHRKQMFCFFSVDVLLWTFCQMIRKKKLPADTETASFQKQFPS